MEKIQSLEAAEQFFSGALKYFDEQVGRLTVVNYTSIMDEVRCLRKFVSRYQGATDINYDSGHIIFLYLRTEFERDAKIVTRRLMRMSEKYGTFDRAPEEDRTDLLVCCIMYQQKLEAFEQAVTETIAEGREPKKKGKGKGKQK